ncbi:aminotransferase class V-fold PLP-dependent enzyme [Metamycoplasma buccale]|uniref:aminotransferase class V-fold PLP-dependent enzyme n=1 Tax=Metamycoplasma buccale TaxID=55602 RepID=UPI00398ECE80
MNYKKMFPMFKNNKGIVYLDNSALTFKPYEVIEEGNNFYEKYSISTRTSDSILGIEVAKKIIDSRKIIGNFIDAKLNETLFTSGTTESLNLAISMLSKIIYDGEIILTYFNHNSNIIPFFEQFKNNNCKFIFALDTNDIISKITNKTKIISLSQITNNFNINFDLKKIYEIASKKNIILINDAAQAISHEKVTLKNSDIIAFSSNKIFGPTGMGILAIKENLLEKLSPQKWGGGQVINVKGCNWTSKNDIQKFEPGTLNFAGIFQFKKAIEFISNIGYETINKIEMELANYAYEKLIKVKDLQLASKKGDKIIMFNIKNISSQDVASYLGHNNIYVRSGVFCAHSFTNLKGYDKSYVRLSLSFYNTKTDINKLVKYLKKGEYFDFL